MPTKENGVDLETTVSNIWYWFLEEKHRLLTISLIEFQRVSSRHWG